MASMSCSTIINFAACTRCDLETDEVVVCSVKGDSLASKWDFKVNSHRSAMIKCVSD